MPLQHPAGTQFEYSDFSWEVVGLLLERLTNKTIEENFQSIVAGPLGMANSSYDCPGANSSATRSHAAIGLCTTVSDLGRFMQMMLLGGRKPDGTRVLAPTVVSQIYSGQTGEAKLFGDEINYTALIPSRCSTGGDGFPGNYTVLDYGFGAAHYVGWRSEAWMHMGSWGVLHFLAPGRYAAVFSTAYPSVQPALDRELRVLDELERLNFVDTPMCPTMEKVQGDFFVKQPAEVPWVKTVVV
jgi:CubicO group peptidase (beta-lactamase class C family)